MSHLIDITGQRYGRLTVIKKVPHLLKNTNTRWLCLCDCGNYTEVAGCHLKSGKIQACGCLQKEKAGELGGNRFRTHGLSKTPIHKVWRGMVERCYSEYNTNYKHYGARGIILCDDWKNNFISFYSWALENGYQKGLTIERINVNGNYEPSNCRWATTYEQGINKTDTLFVQFNYQKVSLKQLYDIWDSPMSYDGVRKRIFNDNWDVEEALCTPPPVGKYAHKYKTINSSELLLEI